MHKVQVDSQSLLLLCEFGMDSIALEIAPLEPRLVLLERNEALLVVDCLGDAEGPE
jgi:hypothetical protein